MDDTSENFVEERIILHLHLRETATAIQAMGVGLYH